jgi:hypothetical protein
LWERGAKIPARESYDIARRAARRGDRAQALRFASMAARAPDVDPMTRAKFALAALREVVTPARADRSAKN